AVRVGLRAGPALKPWCPWFKKDSPLEKGTARVLSPFPFGLIRAGGSPLAGKVSSAPSWLYTSIRRTAGRSRALQSANSFTTASSCPRNSWLARSSFRLRFRNSAKGWGRKEKVWQLTSKFWCGKESLVGAVNIVLRRVKVFQARSFT